MIRVAICDDNIYLANSIENDILHLSDEELSCDVFQSGAELTNYLKSGEKPYNIYFMDIEMPLQNGIETASIIRKEDKDALIIFITNHKEYVYDIFEVLPFRFLQKPVSNDNLRCILVDAIEHIRLSGQMFFFQIGHEKYQLHYQEIIYFEGAGRKVIIKTGAQDFEIYDKISNIAARLNHNLFCQIHASYIVNMDCIRSIKNMDIVLQNSIQLPISKKYRNHVKQAHLSFLERRCII